MNQRNQKANQIFSEVKSIRKITKNQFSVDSQSDNTKSYLVKKLPKVDVWTCECKDFHFRLRKLDFLLPEIKSKSTGVIRRKLRDALDNDYRQIDDVVKQILKD